MKNNKKNIGFLITILLIAILVIAFILLYLKSNDNTQDSKEANGEDFYNFYSTTRDAYFDVNSCMYIYLSSISTKNNIIYSEDKQEFNNKIYDLLSSNYIKQNDITPENLHEYIELIDEQVVFIPLEIATIKNDEVKSFVVHGLAENIIDLSVVKEIYAVVNIDMENNVFSIEPIYGNYNSISDIKITEFESVINENTYNEFSRNQATYEDTAKDYINLYKRLSIGNPEKMYELLDEQYRIAKFGSKENFEKYIEENKSTIIGIRLEKYNAIQENSHTKYTCIDQYGNYYIFIEDDILNYSVILDTYTIDLPEFTEKYQIATTQEKVMLNIQKIVEALNAKDYNYIYSKLADEFKANYFNSYEIFEIYAENVFDIGNEVTYGKYTESEKYCTYQITLKGKSKNITKTIVMKLEEGTDFVMSFNVE